jgi:hypothetical protein
MGRLVPSLPVYNSKTKRTFSQDVTDCTKLSNTYSTLFMVPSNLLRIGGFQDTLY